MVKKLAVILIIGCFESCEPTTVFTPYKYNTNPVYTKAYAEFFGNYYAKDSIPSSVFTVTLLSNGLTNTNGILSGTGQRLYLENVFANPTDTILPAGTYTASNKGGSFSFYPGSTTVIDKQSYTLGAYIDYRESDASRNRIKLISKGSFTVSYLNEVMTLQCNFTTSDSAKLSGTFSGKISYMNSARPMTK
jgi:hypothetical protein